MKEFESELEDLIQGECFWFPKKFGASRSRAADARRFGAVDPAAVNLPRKNHEGPVSNDRMSPLILF